MLRPSEKPQLALDGENDPRRLLWVVYGVIYGIVVGVIAHPAIPEFFPRGSLAGMLLIVPLVGISYLLRDAVQFNYEDTPQKRNKSAGLWVSMVFVLLASLITYQYRDPAYALAGSVTFIIASFVDGLVFSKMKNSDLSSRLLVSNIFAAVFDVVIFVSVRAAQGHLRVNWFTDPMLVFLEILPALVIFVLSMTLFNRAFRVADNSITRKIQRGG